LATACSASTTSTVAENFLQDLPALHECRSALDLLVAEGLLQKSQKAEMRDGNALNIFISATASGRIRIRIRFMIIEISHAIRERIIDKL
jgi:hypothetical protein